MTPSRAPNAPPLRSLPENYRVLGTLDLAHNPRLLLILNGIGLLLIAIFYLLFLLAARWLRPQVMNAGLSGSVTGLGGIFKALLLLVAVNLVLIVIHEGLHGVVMWFLTRTRPIFAFRGVYAYAAAPGWYFSRGQYILVSLTPLVGISLIGLALLAVVPVGLIFPLLLVMTFNVGGAVGDLAVFFWLLRQSATTLAHDTGDVITLYAPGGL